MTGAAQPSSAASERCRRDVCQGPEQDVLPVDAWASASLARLVRSWSPTGQVEEIRRIADAKATEIYANAYNQSPKAVALYDFTRTMQSYSSVIASNTTLVLSTDSDLFKYLKGMNSPD